MIKLKDLLIEAVSKDARRHFRIPRDFKTNYAKYTGVHYGGTGTPKRDITFAWLPLNRLKAAGVPRDVGDHVRHMEKVLKSGKKLPPISVTIASNGNMEVDDGNTRTLALKRMGMMGKVPAVVVGPRKLLDRLEKF